MNVRTEFDWNGDEVKIIGHRVVRKTAYETGLVVEGQAKVLTPVKTGRLAGSITTQASDHGNNVRSPATDTDKINAPTDAMEVLVGTAVDYAPYVEYGTRRSGAQPFLRPALDLAKGNVLTIGRKNGKAEFKDYLK